MNKYAYTLFGFIKLASQAGGSASPMDTPFSLDDLRKVDKKMMDKYRGLTGAGNMNSDMDKWKTLMAAKHGKNWNMYSNDAYKKWRSGLNKTHMNNDVNAAFERQVDAYNQQAAANRLAASQEIESAFDRQVASYAQQAAERRARSISNVNEKRLRSEANRANLDARNAMLAQTPDTMIDVPDRPAERPRTGSMIPVNDRRLRSEANRANMDARNSMLAQLPDPTPQIPNRLAGNPSGPQAPSISPATDRRLRSEASQGDLEAREHMLAQTPDTMIDLPEIKATDPRKPLTPTVGQAVAPVNRLLPSWAPRVS